MTIKKSTIEWILILILFFVSFINNLTLIIFFVLILLLLYQKQIGGVKILNIITIRSIVNPELAVSTGNFELIKWGIIFIVSTYIILYYKRIDDNVKKRIKGPMVWLIIYSIYSILSSLFFSTLPTVASFKVISYMIPLIAIYIGVAYTYQKINWIDWLYKLLIIIVISSLFIIKLPYGYSVNGHAFQGITNHPNLFGIYLVLFIAISLVKLNYSNKYHFYYIFGIIMSIFFIILSESRTSLLSTFIILSLFIFLRKAKQINKILLFFFLMLVILCYLSIVQDKFSFVTEFLLKGQTQNNILYSREAQINGILSNFYRNPLFGSGFGVPVTDFRTFKFSFEYIVEPGNLILSVFSYGGIFGALIFSIYIFRIFLSNLKNFKYQFYLPLSTLLVSMGEMVFFSTNNLGIILYMFIVMYSVYDYKKSSV